jgi:hypothetical protein
MVGTVRYLVTTKCTYFEVFIKKKRYLALNIPRSLNLLFRTITKSLYWKTLMRNSETHDVLIHYNLYNISFVTISFPYRAWGVAEWLKRLESRSRWSKPRQEKAVVSLCYYFYCVVLVGSRNGFESMSINL